MEKQRMLVMDIVKIGFALLIYMRHAITMGSCTFHVFNNAIMSMTSPIMTGFFIVSGFSLEYTYRENIFGSRQLYMFYVKRALGVFPLYVLVYIFSALFYGFDLQTMIRLAPVEVFCIQTWFVTLFGIFQNGGSWFVSCLVLCYFIFPLQQTLLSGLKLRGRVASLLVFLFISVYSGYVCGWFGLADLYSNPLFRMIEFLIGVSLASLLPFIDIKEKSAYPWLGFLVCAVGVVYVSVNYSSFSVALRLVFFSLMFLSAAMLHPKILLKWKKAIGYCSELSYGFFIMQLLLWKPYYAIINAFPVLQRNRYRILTSFLLLLVFTVAAHELWEKPVQKCVKKYLKKYEEPEMG